MAIGNTDEQERSFGLKQLHCAEYFLTYFMLVVENDVNVHVYATVNFRRSNTVSPVKQRCLVQSQYVIELEFVRIFIKFRHTRPKCSRFFHVLSNIRVSIETVTSPLLIY